MQMVMAPPVFKPSLFITCPRMDAGQRVSASAVCCDESIHMLLVQKIPRRILNLPAKLIFPAAPKLLGAQNARAYAVQKIKPYLIKVFFIFRHSALAAA